MTSSGWFSKNPAKAWAERYILVYSGAWMLAVGLVIVTGWIFTWGDLGYLIFSCVLGGGAVLGPLLLPGRPDRDQPFWTAPWFKLNVWVFILVSFGTYFGTHYFFDLMGMKYAFPVTWTFESDIVGQSEQTVPVFMYPLTQAYFMTYFVAASIALRKLTSSLALDTVGRIVAIVALAYAVAWMETFTMASDALRPYFQYADRGRMLALGSLGYASYFVVGLPLVFRIDETEGDRWSVGRVVLQACAACLLILCLLEAWAKLVGPIV